ncbi:MAG: hypothetical protein MUE94_01565 [Verrucomicrobia bacterium]|jgi:hypothetical protein|nr:hypothetical protein [Verrucomicrobiota bacterium]
MFKTKLRMAGAALRAGWVLVGLGGLAQPLPLGQFRDFSLPAYYDAPHETRMKSLLEGREAVPQPGGKMLIRNLTLRTFREDGAGQFVLRAQDCLYDSERRAAASAGPLELSTVDGRFFTEGEGFLWQEAGATLLVSNRVHTVIRRAPAVTPNP